MDHDIDLMLKVKENDLDAFEKLYQHYQKPLSNFFYRLGCDYETSQDYTQEVFFRLWKARNRYKPQAKFTTYLFQIAKNYWLNQKDKKKRRPYLHYLYSRLKEDQQKKIEQLADNQKLPEEKAMQAELGQKIQEAVNSLPAKYRLVFVLSHMEGMRYREIAQILDIPEGTVKSRMHITEQKLRNKLARYLDGENR